MSVAGCRPIDRVKMEAMSKRTKLYFIVTIISMAFGCRVPTTKKLTLVIDTVSGPRAVRLSPHLQT